jgi:tetratricopeptide (TPR) repeat protein
MRKPLIIVLFGILISSTSCSKQKPPQQINSGSQIASAVSIEEDRSRARTYLESGKEYYRKDQDEKASAAFQEAIKLDPGLAEAHFRLGLAYGALGRTKDAEDSLKKAVETYKKFLESNGKDFDAHYNLGQAYAGLHRYEEAVREYRLATKIKSDDSDLYYDLGAALMKLAEYNDAVTAFSKSLEIDPENYRAEDALEESREGAKRILAGKKHTQDLLKKQKEEELKKEQEGTDTGSLPKPSETKKP